MDRLPENFRNLSNKEIEEAIDLTWIAGRRQSGNHGWGSVASILISEKGRRENKVTVRASLALSALALFLSIISVVFSWIDWKGGVTWQKQEIEVLREIALMAKESKAAMTARSAKMKSAAR